MTGENRELNCAEELGRAKACLQEAEVLRKAGLPYGAASRAYYCVFHAARALLFSVGIEPTSHRGLSSLLGERFVKAGALSPAVGRLVARMQRDREDADYSTGAYFTDDEARDAVRNAREVLAHVEGLLPRAESDEG